MYTKVLQEDEQFRVPEGVKISVQREEDWYDLLPGEEVSQFALKPGTANPDVSLLTDWQVFPHRLETVSGKAVVFAASKVLPGFRNSLWGPFDLETECKKLGISPYENRYYLAGETPENMTLVVEWNGGRALCCQKGRVVQTKEGISVHRDPEAK